MQLQQFQDQLKFLETIDPSHLPEFVVHIKSQIFQYQNDFIKLDYALGFLAFQVMKVKDVKPQYSQYYEELIFFIIEIAIQSQFRVGVSAFSYIYNLGADFYKNSDIDSLLANPIGKNRSLKPYFPVLGQQCDIVKPYITSTSVCGWTRCIVKDIQKQKYTVQYSNTNGQTMTRQRPWFAPLGTRMKDYDWRLSLDVGYPIQALHNRVWYKSTVAQVSVQKNCKKVRVTFRRFAEDGDRVDTFGIKFFGLGSGQDEWIQVLSPRIQQCGKMVNKKLCYYSFNTQEIIFDDQYDTIFEQQYKQQPFYSIARAVYSKSLSFLAFCSKFIEKGGIQKLLEVMKLQDMNYDIVFNLFAITSLIIPFVPRMHMQKLPLRQLYVDIFSYVVSNAKNLNTGKIQCAYMCYNCIGRRLYTLTEIHYNENLLRKHLVQHFLKLNMEKQMIALRYIHEIIFPKKPLSEQEQIQFNQFLKKQKIFQQVFNTNTHEQILTRSPFLLNYLIKYEIITTKEFQSLWTMIPVTDTRGRATIQKVLADLTKNLPISLVQTLVEKVLALRETQLTIDNLNLLRELKNRQITNQTQLKILNFLWDILTVKSVNMKTNIEEEAEKVFKSFVQTIKDKRIKMNVLQSMVLKINECKKLKNQIEFLKDLIKSYEKEENTKAENMIDEVDQNVPQNIFQAVTFLKKKQIYSAVLNLLWKSKQESVKKDILSFISFLFQYDFEDVNHIITTIYEKLGPLSIVFQWVHKTLDRSISFATLLLESTEDFSAYENISISGFEAIAGIITDINQKQKNIKVIKKYKYKNENKTDVAVGPVGPVAEQTANKQAKDDKFIGPLLPTELEKYVYVLISPFKLVGMNFLKNLLHVVKQTKVYNSIVKQIIQFVANLDDTIQGKTEEYRRQFLFGVIKEIEKIRDENVYNEKVSKKLLAYINLFTEIFEETEKAGLGDLKSQSEKVEGQKITLKIDNLFNKEKTKKKKDHFPSFNLVCNQNISLWSLKLLVSDIIEEQPEIIDVTKFSDPIKDSNNGKSISDLFFYDNETIKVGKKSPQMIPRCNLLNEEKTETTQKFQKYLNIMFNGYKNPNFDGLNRDDLTRLSKQKWKGIIFKKKEQLDEVFEKFDKEKKEYLTFKDFRNFFIAKASQNQNAVWVLINVSGYKNNMTLSSGTEKIVSTKTQVLPRKILSCTQIYNLIFSIFENSTFKQVHLNFYRLLCMLEVNQSETIQIEQKIYKIIENEESMYALCYSIEVVSSELAKKTKFYVDFWRNNGVVLVKNRIQKILENDKSVYELDTLMKNQILSGLVKILGFYSTELLSKYKVVQFANKHRVNILDMDEYVKKYKDFKHQAQQNNTIFNQLITNEDWQNTIKSIYDVTEFIFKNLIKNFKPDTNNYLSRLTTEVVRVLVCIVGSKRSYHRFQPLDYNAAIRNQSLNNRRSTILLIYIYLFNSEETPQEQMQKVLNGILSDIPKQSKIENGNYFALLNQIINQYMELNGGKDEFFINLGNTLLNRLFECQGEGRTAIISDKIILGILSVIETLLNRKSICLGLSWRIFQITQKCLFAYDIEKKIEQLEIKEELLTQQKQQQHFKNYVMCKTEDTRSVAYKIVQKLHSVSPGIEPLFINKYIKPIITSISSEVRITSSKSLDVGLKNFGSTCYMNSMLQVLNSVGPFRNLMMKCQSQSDLIKQLQNLFSSLYFSERMDYAPGKLLNSFIPPINPAIQQDTTEFLNFLFDQLESGLSKTQYKNLLDQIFKGTNAVQIICHSCGYKKENTEQFFSFGVQIEGKYDLCSALQGSYQGQVISGYMCDSCHNRVDTTKRNILSEIPNVLFIHLRRIVYNYDIFANMKIHTRLQFPQELNIEPYTKEGVQLREKLGLEYMKNLSHNEEQSKKFQQLALHSKQKDFYKLKLKGVIVHSGSADVGHYYSILEANKLWRKYDDSRVSFFGTSGFQSECYGGNYVADQWGSGSSVNAYVLIYQRVIKTPLKFEVGENMVQQLSLPYESIKTYNTVETYKKLWIDNHNFMVETHTLDSKQGLAFMNFLHSLVSELPNEQSKIELVGQIIYQISSHSGIVGDFTKIVEQNSHLIQPSFFFIFVMSDKGKTFKLLFSHDKPLRKFMSVFLYNILIQSFKKGDENIKGEVLKFIYQMLNSMTTEVAKNWLRVDGYFQLLYMLIVNSTDLPQLWSLFFQRRLISSLIDYVMQKQSPVRINPKNYSLGTKTNPMDFKHGISIISFYVKLSYGFNGKNYEVPAPAQKLLFHLSDNDVICLSFMEFYAKMLRERQNLTDLSVIIQRLCIMNLQFSKWICQILLQTINGITDSTDQMQDISFIVLEILKIRDDYWVDRAEMLLGVGSPFVHQDNLMGTFDQQRFLFNSTIYDVFPLQCLFNYVYLYRLKNPLACFQIMKAILQGCSVSDISMRFLCRQPSPNYFFANYLSWMENYIEIFTSFATTNEKIKQRLVGQVEYINKYIKDYHQFMRQNTDVNFYDSLITGQIASKTQIQSFQKEGIEVKLYEIQAYCVDSKPKKSGGNQTLEPYLQSFRLAKNPSSNSNILKFLKKQGKAIALGEAMDEEDKEIKSLFDTCTNEKGTETEAKENKEQMIVEEEPEEQINIANVKTSGYYRQLEFTNKTKDKKFVKVTFSYQQDPNTIVPKQFSFKLFSKNSESIWMSKQKASKDWGPLKMLTTSQQYVKEKHDKKSITFWWFKNYGDTKDNIQQIALQKLNEKQEQQRAENINSQGNQGVNQNQVNCPICTYLNSSLNETCQVCGSALA